MGTAFFDRRAIAAVALLAACAAAPRAAAEPPLLSAPAFTTPQPCVVDPFGDPAAEQRLRMLDSDCGRDAMSLALRTPRARDTDTGPSRIEFEFDRLMTRELLDGVIASARLGYAAAGDRAPDEVRTQRLLLAAGGRWRLDEDLALDLQLGRDAGPARRTRARLGGQWRPVASQLLFAQWAVDDTEHQTTLLGWRWSMWPRRAWLELSARQDGLGGPVEPRFGLRVSGLLR